MCPDEDSSSIDNDAEQLIYEALQKNLPDGFYVFHSLKVLNGKKKYTLHEMDYMFLHPKYGALLLEVKRGRHIKFSNGTLYYDDGEHTMDPFNQIQVAQKHLIGFLKDKQEEYRANPCIASDLLRHFKIKYAVWFPQMTQEQCDSLVLPPNGDHALLLSEAALRNPEHAYMKIMETEELAVRKQERLTDEELQWLMDGVLFPQFQLASIPAGNKGQNEVIFKRMQEEEQHIIECLAEQPIAVINGRAGTGKTVMAVAKARMHAANGEKVLFLTYNSYLNESLKERNKDRPEICFATIAGLCGIVCKDAGYKEEAGKKVPDYGRLAKELQNMMAKNALPWKHVIVDEGQDFGQPGIEDVMDLFWTYAVDEETNPDPALRSFYIFYDRYQMVQGTDLPEYIAEAECRLTVHKNCRNTNPIASTATHLLQAGLHEKPRYSAYRFEQENNIVAEKPYMMVIEPSEFQQAVARMVRQLREDGWHDIVLLTCRNEKDIERRLPEIVKKKKKNASGKFVDRYFYRYKPDHGGETEHFLMTTCRKFKGLEADAVILLDFDMDILEKKERDTDSWQNALLPYEGATRAKFALGIIGCFTDDECEQVIKENIPDAVKKKKKNQMIRSVFEAQPMGLSDTLS